MNIVARRHGNSRGQALVEFALVFPIFVLLVFGLVDLGRAVYAYSTVTNSARSGARVAIVNQYPGGIQDKVIAEGVGLGLSAGSIDLVGYKKAGDPQLGGPHPEAAEDCDPVAPGCVAVVRVHYDFRPVTPLLNLAAFTISSTTEIPVEQAFSHS